MTEATPLSERTRVRLRVPIEGRLWLLTFAVFLATGVFKAINLITLLACAMAVTWCVNALEVRLRLRRLRARQWLSRPVFAAKPATADVEICQTGRRTVLGVRLEARGESHRWSRFVPSVRGGESIRFRYSVTLPRRGWYEWEPVRVSTGFPFGLAEGVIQPEARESILVLPAVGQIHAGRLRVFLKHTAAILGRSRHRPVRLPAAQSEVHGVRSFRDGDSPRWIHWRTTARRAELMVREFEETPSERIIVVLDPSAASALEDAISLAASVCWEWCRHQGEQVVLVVAEPSPKVVSGVSGKEHAIRLLEGLALTEACQEVNDTAFVDILATAAIPSGPLLLITARDGSVAELLAARLRRPVAVVNPASLEDYAFYERPVRNAI